MKQLSCDVAVIGGGAAGLSAAAKAAALGKNTLVIEREAAPGGVLQQCIHNGFGLHYFKAELTGPEYAARVLANAEKAGVRFLCGTAVTQIENPASGEKLLTLYSRADGVTQLSAGAVILAMGCRERCRGNLGIPGDRLAGVFNAGLAQQLLNMEGILPGRKAVIVGSGDIGLIMARRLSWCGIKVECVVEIMPHPSGLSRNIAQCLEDFNIPLHLSTGVTGIHGKERVESISIAPLANGEPDLSRERTIECDTVLFSVGLIPENTLSVDCGVKLNPLTGGALVDDSLMTVVPGIFACGNVLHVHDLVDFVSQEAEHCAEAAVKYVNGEARAVPETELLPGDGVRYVVPNRLRTGEKVHFFLRSRSVMDSAMLKVVNESGEICLSRRLRYVKPAEMISEEIPAATGKRLQVILEEK